MGEKGKFLVTNEGRFDLGTHMWDDQLFSDILVRDNPIDTEKAMGISRSLREEILRLEFQTITMSFIEKMIEAKLLEFGLRRAQGPFTLTRFIPRDRSWTLRRIPF